MSGLPSEVVDASRQVTRGKGSFWGACVEATGAGSADVDFYDGDSSLGRRIYDLTATTLLSVPHILPVPLHFEHGLYVDLGSNVANCIVYYTNDTDPPGDMMAHYRNGIMPAGSQNNQQ